MYLTCCLFLQWKEGLVGGIAEAASKMAFGNKLGLQLYMNYPNEFWFEPRYGTIIAEVSEADLSNLAAEKLSYEKLAIPAASKEIMVSYSQFVPGNTGMNTFGRAILFLAV